MKRSVLSFRSFYMKREPDLMDLILLIKFSFVSQPCGMMKEPSRMTRLPSNSIVGFQVTRSK